MSLLWRHSTKSVGFLQTITGSVMSGMAYLQAGIKPLHYGLLMMAFGVVTSALGFINTSIINAEKDEQ